MDRIIKRIPMTGAGPKDLELQDDVVKNNIRKQTKRLKSRRRG
jgi:hypothetical protein